ncbi:DivIVA domain-containing protein [Aeromicrobium panaciterrae]|uniref:DivIVA domain-containing protein n=1 Tax=Aeromicrobium panaciterrae TaxID=363861 RepID=UPI0031D20615
MTHTAIRTFSKVRLREGYDIDEVDAFLAEVERNLLGPLPHAELARRIAHARFTPVRLRQQGYDMGAVDEHLDTLHEWAVTGRRQA